MNLEDTIKNYQPTEQAIEIVRRTKIVLLVGITAAGKDSIMKQLIKSSEFHNIVTNTTRPPRTNNGILEKDGQDYHFIDNDTAKELLENKEFIEAKFVHGLVYGTSLKEFQVAAENQRIAIADIDVQGVDEYKKISQAVIAIHILPPDYDTWLNRLKARYSSDQEFQAEFLKRKNSAIQELTHALEVPYYHFVVNDKIETAVAAIAKIVHSDDKFYRKDDEFRLVARDLLAAIESN